jgi:hypothetical protein
MPPASNRVPISRHVCGSYAPEPIRVRIRVMQLVFETGTRDIKPVLPPA